MALETFNQIVEITSQNVLALIRDYFYSDMLPDWYAKEMFEFEYSFVQIMVQDEIPIIKKLLSSPEHRGLNFPIVATCIHNSKEGSISKGEYPIAVVDVLPITENKSRIKIKLLESDNPPLVKRFKELSNHIALHTHPEPAKGAAQAELAASMMQAQSRDAMPTKPNTGKRGKRSRYTDKEKDDAVMAWERTDKDAYSQNLIDFLAERFGDDEETFKPFVASSTFYAWRDGFYKRNPNWTPQQDTARRVKGKK